LRRSLAEDLCDQLENAEEVAAAPETTGSLLRTGVAKEPDCQPTGAQDDPACR